LPHRFGRVTLKPMGDDDGVVVSNMASWRGALMGDTPVSKN
jgi:hypothetical protein